MSALDKVPQNLNMLSQMGFRFFIKKLPHVNFFLQDVTIPSVSMPVVSQPNPFVAIKHTGDHIEYPSLDIEFKVDEDLANYRELYAWFRGTEYPDSTAEYRALASKPRASGDGIYSDASLIITTNIMNPKVEFTFRDAFPTSIGSLNFRTTDNDVQYVSCRATFDYTLFDVSVLP